jgi:WD40 repeat protein
MRDSNDILPPRGRNQSARVNATGTLDHRTLNGWHRGFRKIEASLVGIFALLPALAAGAPGKPVSFKDDVAPILVRKCISCHGEKKASGGLSMSTFALLKKGGKTGGAAIIEAGDPESSLLVELVKPDGEPRMPYKQPPLSDSEIKTLELWVTQGARFDGPSPVETLLSSLVDPLRGLPKVTVRAATADSATALAYSPDGKLLAAAVGKNVTLFDALGGKPAGTLGDHPGPLTSVRFTPDGKSLIAAGGRPGMFGSVIVWDVATKARRLELRGHTDAILGAEVSPDGRTLATGSYDKLIVLWDLQTGKVRSTLKDHTDSVYAVAFSSDGKRLASAAADRTVKLWDVASGRRILTLSDATAELYAVAFGFGGQTVIAGGVDRSIRVWSLAEQSPALVNSAFAHDGPIVRLAASRDGKTLISSGEDRDVKVWDLATLKPRIALSGQPDWPQGLALSPSGDQVAVGRYDGSITIYNAATGNVALALSHAPRSEPVARRELARNATLNPISPRGAARGAKLRTTLSGLGVGQATAVVFNEPGLSATMIPRASPDPNALDIELAVAADARVGIHRVGVITPLGVPAFQAFAVARHPELSETEPNDDPAKVKPIALPMTLLGTVDRPGDIDHFRFEGKAGQQLIFEMVGRSLGSGLTAVVSLVDDHGKTIAEVSSDEGAADPTLTATLPHDGTYALRIADADYSGSGNHFYRISAGPDPYVTRVFPLGVERGKSAKIEVSGLNLAGVSSVPMPIGLDSEAGSIRGVGIPLPGGTWPFNARTVVAADGPQHVESEPNDAFAAAQAMSVPGGVSGRIGRDGDADFYRFPARKGETLIIEVFGRRLGTAIDTSIEILDAAGKPVPRAVLRAVAETNVAFRDHGSTGSGIRLTQWNNLAINDTVLIGREVTKIEQLPRNPDDDCQFWNLQGARLGMLETTPEHHPMGQSIYKVEVHPPGTKFPPGGVPPVTLMYRNDDGGPGFGKDSRLTFQPPADGSYLVRVEDVRGLGGEDFAYHLVVRRPHPDFGFSLSAENLNIPRGGAAMVTVVATRLDGFDGPIDVSLEGLPEGISATSARVDRGEFTAQLAVMADPAAPAFSPPTWKAYGVDAGDSAPPGIRRRHEIDPGGPRGGWVTVTPPPNLQVTAEPGRLEIRPGEQVSMKLSVVRSPAFSGRVPIDVRNLPQGVRVLNIGLNGVLITETQTERTVFVYAEPWAEPMERPFYAVAKAESAGTEHSSTPITLIVKPTGPATAPKHAASR